MHCRTYRLIASGLAALTVLGRANASAQEARSRDSAGVRIVENAARKDAPVRFRLGDKPLFEVGGLELNPDEEFDHKQGYLRGVRLSNGGFAVIDVSRVHYFDARGKRVRIVGKKGRGPEEFLYLTSICRTRGDTLILYDSHNRRLSVLDGNGRILRTILQGDNGNAPTDFCLDDGSFVLERMDQLNGLRQKRVTRLRTDGSIRNVVGSFRMLFDMITMAPTSIAVSGDLVYYGNPFTSEIRVYDSSGNLRRIIRTADKGDRITDTMAEERMAWTIPGNVTGTARTKQMDRLRALPRVGNTWPAFYRFVVGSDGTIWVQDYDQKTLSGAWTAIDSSGRIVGRLIFPSVPWRAINLEVHSFGHDYVIVRRIDTDMASSLAIYPFVKIDGRSR